MRAAELEIVRSRAVHQLLRAPAEDLPRLLSVFDPKTLAWRNDG
jgi:hypothetical protein